MTTQLEERLSQEMSASPSTTTITDSAAFADEIIGRVDRRARRHRTVFTGTIAAFAAAISTLAWTARTSLTISTDGGEAPGQLASPSADIDPSAGEAATSTVEAALQTSAGASTLTTMIAFLMLLGLPLLAGFTSWRRPANSALSELGRVGRAVLTMLLAFFALVSFAGLLVVRNDSRSVPNLISELHARSWIALALLLIVAIVPWVVRFDTATLRSAVTRDIGGVLLVAAISPFVFAASNVDNQFGFLTHSGLAVIVVYWCYSRLPRVNPLKRSQKVVFGAVAATLIAFGFAAFTWQVLFFPTGSMEPTLERNSRGIVNRLDTTVDRGDVITYLPQRSGQFDRIRRVIGLGNDTVAGRDGQLFVNGVVPDYFIGPEAGGTRLLDFDEVTVPVGELFVMGDNYANSSDSRHEGTVPIDLVNGTESEFGG